MIMPKIPLKGMRQVQNDYKKIALLLVASTCTFKCEKEGHCAKGTCQNGHLAKINPIKVDAGKIIAFYKNNPLCEAFIFGGLEPMDSFAEFFDLIYIIRSSGIEDDIVFYTGYTKEELEQKGVIKLLQGTTTNIYIKYGRYIENDQPRFDEVLQVTLVSGNQYAERIC